MQKTVDVQVREVGLRDGLQMISQLVPTADKLAWVAAELLAGVAEIEVTSLVSASLMPQFADAADVISGALAMPGLEVVALIPNLRGAERGFALGVKKLNYVVSVSKTHNLKNVRREREASIEDFARIVRARDSADLRGRVTLAAGLSTAFGCSYEGAVAVDEVRRCAAALAEAGAEEILVADTVGYGDPVQVRKVFKAVFAEVGSIPVSAHFHDTRGIGLANVVAALDCDVRRFDASLGGLGGCPYAPGASGNIVMEDLCFMLDSMGLHTGVNLQHLLGVRAIAERALKPGSLGGELGRAGLPNHYRTTQQSLIIH